MTPRKRAKLHQPTGLAAKPQITLAHLIVQSENILRSFVKPLLLAGFFIALSWMGLFTALYPWAHLVALTLFVILLADAFSRAHLAWKPATDSDAKRRVEEASGLKHRPLDVPTDQPVMPTAEQAALWQQHAARAKEQTKKLRWPAWKANFTDQDPYAMRYALAIMLVIGVLTGWGTWGARMASAVNPAIGTWHMAKPALDAWITPPAYTHLPPIMIVTPAGLRHDKDTIIVPEGSIISAHLAEKDGDAPTLGVNDQSVIFAAEDQKDFEATQTITSGHKITIRRGWQTLGSWNIRVVTDQAPQIAFSDTPSVSERKSLRIPFEATDDYGISNITLRVTPKESLPGISNDPLDIALAAPDNKDVKRSSYEDLTAHVWAGLPVSLQLIARDAVGHEAASDKIDFTLPERVFVHPIARALIEERKKLLQNPYDDTVRNEAANIMAGVAHQPASYRGDPAVLMALRAGAVRLVLDHDMDASLSAESILWQTAVRIEDGSSTSAEQMLRQAEHDLADALDRNASEHDIQKIIDRLHKVLAQYLAEISTRMAQRPGPMEDLSPLMGARTNSLSPGDLDRMLEQMRNLSASGSRDAAREELARLQQLMENLRTGPVQLSEEQRAALQHLKDLRALTHDQKNLIDKTFQKAESATKKDNQGLAGEQGSLLSRLQELMKDMGTTSNDNLTHGSDAMQRAGGDLKTDMPRTAVQHQNEALKALQQAEESMQDNLRQNLFMMPQPGMGEMNRDPFGRSAGMFQDDHSVKVPDQMEVRHVRQILDELQRRAGDMARPKIERDYIDRLLQNF